MPAELTRDWLAATRLTHGRQRPDLALRTEDDAVRFIDQMGLVLLFRSPTLDLPNLADACVGGTWDWGNDPTGLSAWALKETLPGAGRVFYAKLLGGRGTFVSWALVPALLATWRPLRRAAALTEVEAAILRIVSLAGPIATRPLRREVQAQLPCESGEVRAAIATLQDRLRITVAGGSLDGWSMHEWDLVERRLSPKLRRQMAPAVAQQALVRAVVGATLATKPGAIARLFGWTVEAARLAVSALVAAGEAGADVPIAGLPGRFVVAPDLLRARL